MPKPTSEFVHAQGPKSRFTFRDLDRLGKYSPQSPLRVIALVDYDAFYAQCETVRLNLDASQPLAVQQWHAIIALNYPARGFGFSRGASVDDVKRLCPNIIIQHVATWREGESSWAYRSDAADPEIMKKDKAALDPYRIQSRRSLKVIANHLPPAPLQRIEKASVDEVFLDLSAQVHSILLSRHPELAVPNDPQSSLPSPPQNARLDWKTDNLVPTFLDFEESEHFDWDDVALNIGAEIIRALRKELFEKLHYTCSAGVAQNKAIAKLAAGSKKPDWQTVVRSRAIPLFLSTCKMTSIRGLAGAFGSKAEEAFGTSNIPDLLEVSQEEMVAVFGAKDGLWLFRIIRGIDHSEVIPRTDPQSMLAQKTFVPPLTGLNQASSWMRIFTADLVGRLNDLRVESGCFRRPTTLAVHHHIRGRFGTTMSKQCTLSPHTNIDEETIFHLAMKQLKTITDDLYPAWPCLSFGLSFHGLVKEEQNNQRITSFMPATLERSHSSEETRKRRRDGAELEPSRKQPATPFKDTTGENGYLCPSCGKTVQSANVLEHLDWHVAMDLQKQL
ncbi:hypothetical protein VTL71DRAFT_2016 [Oculimacula yallundae]|uniref:DNA polymerase eta n=1 Tax=Oculimacula yallundae TaxID=86028 RepID=A0ABR4CEA2_9HELO